jgi:hypothetical protein
MDPTTYSTMDTVLTRKKPHNDLPYFYCIKCMLFGREEYEKCTTASGSSETRRSNSHVLSVSNCLAHHVFRSTP